MASLEELLQRKYDPSLGKNETLAYLSELIDLAGDQRSDVGIAHALQWADEIFKSDWTGHAKTQLHYFCANAWAHRYKSGADEVSWWAWEDEVMQNEIVHLRKAVAEPNFETYDDFGKCQILTNLAGLLSRIGRYIEAEPYWKTALFLNPRFGMALGNRGLGQMWYAELLYEPHSVGLFLQSASQNLSAALSKEAEYESAYKYAKDQFQGSLERINKWLTGRHVHFKPLPKRLRSPREKKYRLWCFSNRLCLNPCNEIGNKPRILADDLQLPDFVTKTTEIPSFLKFFNLMKEEYVAARWFFYDGLTAKRVHFADRDAVLYETLDYSCLGIDVEKVKAAYKQAYSILDKIAFFVNSYFELGHKPHIINFRNVWRKKPGDKDSFDLHPKFLNSKNRSLRGLYWLSKDIFEVGERSTMEPEARDLWDIRNHLEHKILTIHELILHPQQEPGVYAIERNDFQRRTKDILSTARAALIYLALAMHHEEEARAQSKESTGASMPIHLSTLPDTRKKRW